jgi:hypothetical protein
LVDHSGAASRKGGSDGTGLEPSSFGNTSVRSREDDLLFKARLATIVARAFVGYPEAGRLVAMFGSWGFGKPSTLNLALEAPEKLEGVSIRNEAMLPRGSVSFLATRGRLLGSDNRTKASALA